MDLDAWLREPLSKPVLLIGPSSSGKTATIRAVLDRHKETHHEVALACPEQGISPIVFMEKRLLMKDVMCLFSCPIYTLDSLDTMIAGEKSVITDFVKLLKTNPVIQKKKLIFVASTAIEKKVTELKKLCHIVRLAGGPGTVDGSATADTFMYTFHDAIAAGPKQLSLYFRGDPWLTVLGIIEAMGSMMGVKRYEEFLAGFLTWGEMISASGDDFFHEDTASIATTYMAWYVQTKLDKEAKSYKIAGGNGGKEVFTHLLTLHSVRKRTWTEKYESGLPWMADPGCRLGGKFSESTISGIWRAS